MWEPPRSILKTSPLRAVSLFNSASVVTTIILGALYSVTSAPLNAQQAPTLPHGGAFVAGTGTIGAFNNGSLTVTQSSNRGVIDWKSFSIGAQGKVLINNGSGATLNRVLGGELSRIEGLLKASGSVYLVNPNGIVVGPGGQVLTGGSFVGSTRNVTNDSFLSVGNMKFSGTSTGDVTNLGSILARDGNVLLIGNSVQNAGAIKATNGVAALLAGNDILLTAAKGTSGIYISPGASGNISQTGRIEAAATALRAAGGNIYALAGNRTGLISATGTKTIDGEIWLSAPEGSVNIDGRLTATNNDGTGGKIVANGASVFVGGNAQIAALGRTGGTVLIGTSKAASGVDLAKSTTIADDASILAGGPAGGGVIETSGQKFSLGKANIQAGKGGSWLVDPTDLTIDSNAASTIIGALNSGTDVTEQTTASGAAGAGEQSAGAGDIFLNAPILWTGSGNLTLSAYNNLNINAALSGGGNFTAEAGGAITTNASVSAANVAMSAAGNLALAPAGTIAGAAGVTLKTGGHFTNNAGASALSAGTGNWLVYSTDPSGDATGGLTPNFLQYAAGTNAAPAASGNGLLYSVAPSLSLALSGTVEKTYDGNTTANFNNTNASVSGLINNDAALVQGSYASKNAGSNLGVTVSNIAVTHGGVPVYGYAGTSPSASANIGQIDRATLSATITGTPTKTYNGTTTAELRSANYQISGFATGEGATVNQPSSVAYDSADAGARIISATFGATNFVANSGTSFSNYVLPTAASGAGVINPAPLLITGVLATDKIYDRTTADILNTTAAALYGKIGSDDVNLVSSGAAGTFATANAGSNQSVAASGFTLSGAKAGDYLLTQPQGLTATISQAALSVGGVTANNKTYDGTATAMLNTGSAALNGVISGDSVALRTGSATGSFSTSDAGSAIPITASGFSLSGTNASNYRLSQPSGLTADINRRALTAAITATPTKVYNDDASAVVDTSGFSLSGFVAGQSATIGQTAHTYYASANAGTQAVTATLAVSDYVAGSGTKLSNYLLPSSVSGTGVINPAPISISLVGNPTKAYDGNTLATLSSSNFLMYGFLTGQSATINQTSGTYDSPNAGPRQVTTTISAGNLTAGPGTLLTNYSFPSSVSGFGTINPRPLQAGEVGASITGNPTKLYDGNTTASLQPGDFSLAGFVNGDGATVTQTVGHYATKNVGVQPVSVSLAPADFSPNSGTDLSNYSLPTAAYGSGTINPAPLNISVISTPTKVYNGTLTATLSPGNFNVSGLAPGEGINIAGGVPAAYDSNQAGSRSITATLPISDIVPQADTLLSNYIVPSSANGPGLITQAPLTIVGISARNKTYDSTANATIGGTASLFGVVGGDQVNLSNAGASASFASANAANGVAVSASGYTISGNDAANYHLEQPSGLSANIGRAALSITGVSAQNKNYDATNTATLTTGSAALAGVFAPDNGQVSLNSTNATAAFSSVNVGNGLSVTASGFDITGGAAGNYSVSQPTGLFANILPAPLTALIVGNPTKVYDGSSSTTLHAANYQLIGFAPGQGGTVPQNASANYVAPDAGSEGIVSTLVSSDFLANAGTNLANYVLPTTGSGTGTITKAPVTAKIVGNPTKTYDATTAANLNSANYQLSGFISGQGASVTQTLGSYGSPNAGTQSVSASLAGGDFSANGSTNLNNYDLPVSALGTGTINKAPLQVISVNATNRAYNGGYADTLDVSHAGVSGLLSSDTVNLDGSAATGTFASKDVGTGIGVTATGFTISGGASNNYTLAQPTGLAADITQASLSLTKVLRTYDSTTSLPGSSNAYTLGGIFGADSVSVDTTNLSGSYADKNVGNGKSVSVSGLALSGAQAGNYTIAPSVSQASIGQITPAPLTVTNAHALDKVYDTTSSATLDNSIAILSGLFAGDAVNLDSGGSAGFFANKNVGPNKSVSASGYSISGLDATNYTFTQPSGLTASITPYTGIALTSISKVYDGTLALPTAGSAYTLDGLLGSDSVSVNSAGVSGAYATKDVGSGLAVSLSGLALTGVDAGNYSISSTLSNSPIGTISQKTLAAYITGTPTKTYDTTNAATLSSGNFNLSGFVPGESATVTKNSGAYASANAGTSTIWANLASGDFTANGSTLLGNYKLPTTASGAGKINKAPLSITGVLATDKVYDGTTADVLDTSSAAFSGLLGSDTATLVTSGAAGVFASPGVGTNIAVSANGFTAAGGQSTNYTLSQPTGLSANISRAILNLASVNKVYDATTSAVGAGVSYTLSGIQGSDAVALNTSGLSGSYADKNVGSGLSVSLNNLSLIGAQAGNYSIGSSVNNALIGTITKAPLTMNGIVAVSKVYDGNNAANLSYAGATIVGLLGQDQVVFSGSTVGTFASSNAGSWTVTPSSSFYISGADAYNYNFAQPTGFSATITRAPLAATITGNPTKTYNNSTAAILNSSNYLLTGFVGSQSASVNQTAGSYDSADAGARTVSAALSAGNFSAAGGTNLANYILPTSATGVGTINAKALAAGIIGNPTKNYDGTNSAVLNAGNFSLAGFVAGQGATVTETEGTYDIKHAGSRSVTASLSAGDFNANSGTNLANYILPTAASGSGTISQKALSAAITGTPTKVYDGNTTATLGASDYSLSGFVAGEGATVSQGTGAYDSKNAGSRTVTTALNAGDFLASGSTQLSDYVLPTSAAGAGLINAKVLTASIIGDPAKVYDATTAALLGPNNYVLSGFVSGEDATISQTAGDYSAADAGPRVVSAALGAGNFAAANGTDLSNYQLPLSASGMGTISPRNLTATISGTPSKTYDGTVAALLSSRDYALSGFVAGQGATVNQTAGVYDSANAGARAVSSVLSPGDFAGNAGTVLTNYVLPTSAAGSGSITPTAIGASIVGMPTKIYDGGTLAALSPANYALSGFVGNEGSTVNQTSGSYDSADAGSRNITAALNTNMFVANSGTDLANYTLPTLASGAGRITQKLLSAAITSSPTKIYDGSDAAALDPNDFSLTGFLSGQGASITQRAGHYASVDAGNQGVSATLSTADFLANAGTNLANYALPGSAAGNGTINPKTLQAAITGNPSKAYDGTNAANLTPQNYSLTGFVGGQGGYVSQTSGSYDGADAGAHAVTANLTPAEFVANSGTNLHNYVLPSSASGNGAIQQKVLNAAITGTHDKTYDGTADALLGSDDYSLTGFVSGQGGAIIQPTATYDSANAGARTVSALLMPGNFTANSGTNLANYVLPASASGTGTINPKMLTGVLNIEPAKVYDGNTAALIQATDYAVTGFVPGQSATVNQTKGAYDSAQAGARLVTVLLNQQNFDPAPGTLLSNYILPTVIAGPGSITPKALSAAILGTPTKMSDGTVTALLTPGNFALSGLISGEGAAVNQNTGAFDSPQAGNRVVTANLAGSNFIADSGTLLSNYVLPKTAIGAGLITPAVEIHAPTLAAAVSTNMAVRNMAPTAMIFDTMMRAVFGTAVPRTYVPFPAPGGLSTWRNNGFGSLPTIVDGFSSVKSLSSDGETLSSGAPVMNTTEQILLQGGKDKQWRLRLPLSQQNGQTNWRAQ
jgi:filamentous hemagglutinin family protein